MNEMGIIELYSQAGIVVKLVLLLLVIFSITSWGIIISKHSFIKLIERNNDNFFNIYKRCESFKEILEQSQAMFDTPFKSIFEEGYRELNSMQVAANSHENVDQQKQLKSHFESFGLNGLERALDNGIASSRMGIEKKMAFLASIGSSTPFIGLFGTVWGIMDSFSAFASGGATIEKIAPGIAEALIATAVGLAVAIPAVIFYNQFNNRIDVLTQKMENFKREFINQVERTMV